jgi:hypothetical protein
MNDTSKNRRLVIRLTPEQQADLKNALGIEKPCEFLEVPLPKSTERSIDNKYGPLIVYGVPGVPDSWGKERTIKIID